MKQTGERSAGDPHAEFDVAGAGNVTMVAGLWAIAKAVESPPARTPVRDPTCGRLVVKFRQPTRQSSKSRGVRTVRRETPGVRVKFPESTHPYARVKGRWAYLYLVVIYYPCSQNLPARA